MYGGYGKNPLQSKIKIPPLGFDPTWKTAHSTSDRVAREDTPERYTCRSFLVCTLKMHR